MPSLSTAIVWFRRDLRVHDHPALQHALERFDRVLPLFVVDDGLLGGRWRSPNRRWFLARALESLGSQLEARGGRLTVVRGDPVELVPRIARDARAAAIVVSRDYAPYGRRRDAAVEAAVAPLGIEWLAGRGLLVHEPEDVRREGGGAFHVFSPFHRRWLELDPRPVLEAPRSMEVAAVEVDGAGSPANLLDGPVPSADPELLLEPSEAAARLRLDRWASSDALAAYASDRDRLDLDGTSRLSQDLRWGLLSPVEVLGRVAGSGAGPTRFRNELAWRDFYAHLLWHEPRVARESFRRELDELGQRAPDRDLLDAWTSGRTGYPVVDAAMRQLTAMGWMHNRARMIVASFLTKHLRIDWRLGEAHFMEHLVDGDPASNNGGWQWAASTGTDPQPYFRVFNPTLQGRRHDPGGDYVRRWVDELRDAPASMDVHEPPPGAYIPRIVEHASARAAALEAFGAASSRASRD